MKHRLRFYKKIECAQKSFCYILTLVLCCLSALCLQGCKTIQANPTIVTLLQEGKRAELEAMLTEDNVNTRDKDGQTLLHIAAKQNNIEEVAIFVKKGARIDSTDANGKTPLLVALERRNLEIAEYLAGQGANIFISDNMGNTPFSYAKEVSLLDHILNSKTIGQRDKDGKNAIYHAIENYDVSLTKKILGLGIPSGGKEDSSLLNLAYRSPEKKESATIAALLLISGQRPLSGEFDEFEKAVIRRNYATRFANGMTALHVAAAKNHLGFIEYLISEGCPVNAKNASNSTALHEAVRSGNETAIATLLANGADPAITDSFGNSSLHIVMPKEKRFVIFTLLLSGKISPNIKDSFGESPLHIATRLKYDLDVIKLLVTKGANIEEKNLRGETPLYLAVQGEQKELIKYFASIGGSIHNPAINGKTPFILSFSKTQETFLALLNEENIYSKDANGEGSLHIAVRHNAKKENVSHIIENSNLLNSFNVNSQTPLHIAVDMDHEVLGSLLIESGANIFLQNNKGYSPFTLAVELSGKRYKWFFTEKTMTAKDDNGNTALHIASGMGYAHVIRDMVEKGADINATNNSSETPLFWAFKKDFYTVVKVLLAISDSPLSYIAKRDFMGNTPLHVAVRERAYNSAKLLLSQTTGTKLFVNLSNLSGSSSLHDAASAGDLEFIKLLLAYNADITAQDNSGKSPLSRAILANKLEAAKLLLVSGSSPVQQDMNGITPLHEAVSMVHNIYDKSTGLKIIKMLRDAGGNPMAKDSDGRTPLSMVLEKDVALIQAVLGSDKFISDSDGRTPLHLAIIEGVKPPIVNFLLKKGYPINKRDRQGETALFCAIDRMQLENALLLFEKGANPFIVNNTGECAVTLILKKRDGFLEMLAKANVIKKDAIGDNVLHYAARFANKKTIKALLALTKEGIDEKNTLGESPYQVALHWQKKDVADLFEPTVKKEEPATQKDKTAQKEKPIEVQKDDSNSP